MQTGTTSAPNHEPTGRDHNIYETIGVIPGAYAAFRLRPNGTFELPYATPSIVEVYGTSPEALSAAPGFVRDRTNPADRDRVEAALARSAQVLELFHCDYRFDHPSRGEIWLEVAATPTREADGSILWHGCVREITERKRSEEKFREAEAALRASEDRYRRVLEVLPDAVFVQVNDRITYCNAAFVRLSGARSSQDLLGRDPLDLFHPDDHARIRARDARIRETAEPAPPFEKDMVGFDGARRRVSVVATPILDAGRPGILVVLHDLAGREKTEGLLGSVLESVTDAIVTIDANGVIVALNPATGRLFGYADHELVGQNVSVLMPEPDRSAHDGFVAAFDRRRTKVIGRGREVLGRRKDGATFPVEVTIAEFRLGDVQHFTGVIRDLTDRKRLEEQFRQAHKMEAFGQLAGGVAHDFNNLLTIILGATAYLSSAVENDEEATAAVADVNDAAERAASLTRQLLAFSRKTVLEPKVLDINLVVRETEKMLRRLIGEDIHLSTKLAPNLEHTSVDPGQLVQILMNLAVNARDAMPRGGELEILTGNILLGDADARAFGLAPGPFVRLTVRDTGCGMPASVLERVFQPFFTTKGLGHGTGLGLAVVHGIVTQSGGAVRVDSVEGKGATFEIYFPAASCEQPTRGAPGDTVHPATGSVLLVEDDEGVRRLALRVLAANGYRVLAAPNGAEALALLERQQGTVDLVVTDVVMPRMDGGELGNRISARFPQTKILYVSGYTDDALASRGLGTSGERLLAKPYTPVALLQAVRQALVSR